MPQNCLVEEIEQLRLLIEGMRWMLAQPHVRRQPAAYRKMGQQKLENAIRQKEQLEAILNVRKSAV